MNTSKEVRELNIQLLFSILSIVTIIISIILIQNEKQFKKKEKTILNVKQADNLSKFNRVLILIIALVFLVVNYHLKDLSSDEDLKSYDLQIIASYLVVFSALITLYVVFTSPPSEEAIDVENPII